MPISGNAKTFSALLYHLVANTVRTLVTSFHVRIGSRGIWQAVENQVHSIYLGSLASSNVGSRGFGSEASDSRGRQNRAGAGARVVFQGDG